MTKLYSLKILPVLFVFSSASVMGAQEMEIQKISHEEVIREVTEVPQKNSQSISMEGSDRPGEKVIAIDIVCMPEFWEASKALKENDKKTLDTLSPTLLKCVRSRIHLPPRLDKSVTEDSESNSGEKPISGKGSIDSSETQVEKTPADFVASQNNPQTREGFELTDSRKSPEKFEKILSNLSKSELTQLEDQIRRIKEQKSQG